VSASASRDAAGKIHVTLSNLDPANPVEVRSSEGLGSTSLG
jgi:hypothetical protein